MIHGVWGQKICYPANEFFQTRPPREKYVVCFGFLLRWLNCTSSWQSEVLSISQSDIFKAAHISSVISSWNPPLPGLLPFLFRAWLPLPVNMFGSCVSCIQFQWYIITQYASPSWWNECMFASMTTSDYTRNVDCSGGVLIVRVVCFLIPPWNVIWSDQSYTWNTW